MFDIINKSGLDLGPLEGLIHEFMPFAQERHGFRNPPKLFLLGDKENAANPLGKTGGYNPDSMEISVYVTGRHPKDILRSLSHELVHHNQNERGDLSDIISTTLGYAQDDPHMRDMESEAYEQGNLCFRDWEDGRKKQLQESIYYNQPIVADGSENMSEKQTLNEWKNNEINHLLMKKFGLMREERKQSDDVAAANAAAQNYHEDESGEKRNTDEDEEEEDDEDSAPVNESIKKLDNNISQLLKEDWARKWLPQILQPDDQLQGAPRWLKQYGEWSPWGTGKPGTSFAREYAVGPTDKLRGMESKETYEHETAQAKNDAIMAVADILTLGGPMALRHLSKLAKGSSAAKSVVDDVLAQWAKQTPKKYISPKLARSQFEKGMTKGQYRGPKPPELPPEALMGKEYLTVGPRTAPTPRPRSSTEFIPDEFVRAISPPTQLPGGRRPFRQHVTQQTQKPTKVSAENIAKETEAAERAATSAAEVTAGIKGSRRWGPKEWKNFAETGGAGRTIEDLAGLGKSGAGEMSRIRHLINSGAIPKWMLAGAGIEAGYGALESDEKFIDAIRTGQFQGPLGEYLISKIRPELLAMSGKKPKSREEIDREISYLRSLGGDFAGMPIQPSIDIDEIALYEFGKPIKELTDEEKEEFNEKMSRASKDADAEYAKKYPEAFMGSEMYPYYLLSRREGEGGRISPYERRLIDQETKVLRPGFVPTQEIKTFSDALSIEDKYRAYFDPNEDFFKEYGDYLNKGQSYSELRSYGLTDKEIYNIRAVEKAQEKKNQILRLSDEELRRLGFAEDVIQRVKEFKNLQAPQSSEPPERKFYEDAPSAWDDLNEVLDLDKNYYNVLRKNIKELLTKDSGE
jgi:hypothetical protein